MVSGERTCRQFAGVSGGPQNDARFGGEIGSLGGINLMHLHDEDQHLKKSS